MRNDHDCIVYGNSLGRCGLCGRRLKTVNRVEREREQARWEGQLMAVLGLKPNPIAEYGPDRVEAHNEQRIAMRRTRA